MNFQNRVNDWMQVCFGPEIASDIMERNYRFLEESLELVQSTGITKEDCHKLVEYVFNRDKGITFQELGGVMVTIAALSNALSLSMEDAGETELQRIWTKVEAIRKKHEGKPHRSPLPGPTEMISNRIVWELPTSPGEAKFRGDLQWTDNGKAEFVLNPEGKYIIHQSFSL